MITIEMITLPNILLLKICIKIVGDRPCPPLNSDPLWIFFITLIIKEKKQSTFSVRSFVLRFVKVSFNLVPRTWLCVDSIKLFISNKLFVSFYIAYTSIIAMSSMNKK